MSEAKYIVGIDLGTSNCALSFSVITGDTNATQTIEELELPQVTAPGTIESRPLLPSFLYLPNEHELADGALALPWDDEATVAVGSYARSQSAKVPDRTVTSSKSWLCHDGADRRGPILPWAARNPDIEKVSPIETATQFLLHLSAAFADATGVPLHEQQVVVTVPASFDPAARDLTVEAAEYAGLGGLSLLEEPQAALYSWLDQQGNDWRKQLTVGDVVLVCDIGGGTTDFSLIAITESGGSLELERLAVGEHILLGGDNMDFALAFALRKELESQGSKLDRWQLTSLVQGARAAKEALLADPTLNTVPIVVPNRGSKLFQKNIKAELSRQQVLDIVTDGFFPECGANDMPRQARRTGLTQMGLPYAQDAAVTRHLAQFLARQSNDTGDLIRPTAVLFNGGVLQSAELRTRLVDVLNGWLSEEQLPPIKVLPGAKLDTAVARGATYYGQAKSGRGVRIRGGTARSYYVGVEEPMPAVPGFEPPIYAICVAPFGMEEGSDAHVEGEPLGLVIGEPASFRFFSSTVRRGDAVGTILQDWSDDDLTELPAIETQLSAGSGDDQNQLVEVVLQSSVTTTGTLALYCVDRSQNRRWKLEFDVRGHN